MVDITPYRNSVEPKKWQVGSMFDRISASYDFLNRTLSFGIDAYWRRRAIAKLVSGGVPRHVLDVATGTADLGLVALGAGVTRVTGVDISEKMMAIGRIKIDSRGLSEHFNLQYGDSEQLPFDDGKFDGVMAAFGVRNFANLDNGLLEMCRVLRLGGKLVILEFSKPRGRLFAGVYSFYFNKVLPLIGGFVSHDKEAYNYLNRSVSLFPDGKNFLNHLKNAGFSHVAEKRLSLGICTIYTALKIA